MHLLIPMLGITVLPFQQPCASSSDVPVREELQNTIPVGLKPSWGASQAAKVLPPTPTCSSGKGNAACLFSITGVASKVMICRVKEESWGLEQMKPSFHGQQFDSEQSDANKFCNQFPIKIILLAGATNNC